MKEYHYKYAQMGHHPPGLQRDPEAVEEAKVALVGGDKTTRLLHSVLEVKGIVAPSRAEGHSRSNIMTVLGEELHKWQGYTFIQVEPGHTLCSVWLSSSVP
jgi:hypothetical protein